MAKGDGIASGLIPFSERTKEERHEIAMKAVEKRRRNKEEKMMLQKCMKALLTMNVNSNSKRKVLRNYGFKDDEMNNKALLMVALFKKGIDGDVPAIREITNMMDKLDMFEHTGNLQQNVIVNVMSADEGFQMSEEIEREIGEAEEDY